MITQSKRVAAFIVIAVSFIALAGCKLATNQMGEAQWKLVGWSISSINPADVTITAKFEDGQISGSGGVNSYGGPCQLGPGDAFSAGPLAATAMAGPEPAMRAEAAYFTLLGEARFYTMADGKLMLYDQGKNESLIFEAASSL